MKKIIVGLAFMIMSIGCSNSSSSDDATSSIVGNWKLQSATKNGANYPIDNCDLLHNTKQFNENLSGATSEGLENRQNVPCFRNSGTMNYEFSSSVLTIFRLNSIEKYNVTSLTNTSLYIKFFYRKDTRNGQDFTSNVPANEQVTLYYKKI